MVRFVATLVLTAAMSASVVASDIVDTALAAGSFKTLAAALQAADLVDALKGDGPFTVFAPTDEAFEKLPAGTVETLLKPENRDKLIGILTYHVVPVQIPARSVANSTGATTLNGQRINIRVEDGSVKVDQATVIQTDIACTNGLIHVIDEVILPAADTIPATAEKAGSFGTLLAAAEAAGLAEVLFSDGPFTVFAPTDEAFAALPEGTVESLLKPESKAKLVEILKYHVVPGRVYSTDALAAGKARTLQGDFVTITVDGGQRRVNAAKLVLTDLDASNGVIHVIDSVLLPSANSQAMTHPREIIETAIGQGAPLYNAGHHGECARIYMSTVENLIGMEHSSMCASTTQTLRTALARAQQMSSANSQAWELRNALDSAYRATR